MATDIDFPTILSPVNFDYKSKYVMATICIPVEVKPGGEQIIHDGLYQVKYELIDCLPTRNEANKNKLDVSDLFTKINESYRSPSEYDITFKDNSNSNESEESESESESESDNDDGSELVFKSESSDIEMEDESDESDIDFPTIHPSIAPLEKPQIRVLTQQPEQLVVSRHEIQPKRHYPKSRTFRNKELKRQTRFTRKSDMRYFPIPESILQSMSIT